MAIKLNSNSIVTNKEGKFLLVRLKKGYFRDKLCIPGGGVNFMELGEDAARREVLEETGIEAKGKFVHYGFCELMSDKIGQHKIAMLFHTEAEGIPTETDEGIADWYDYDEAEPEMLEFTKQAIRIWRENKVHFKLGNADGDIKE